MKNTMINIIKWVGLIVFVGYVLAGISGFARIAIALPDAKSVVTFIKLSVVGLGLWSVIAASLVGLVVLVIAIVKKIKK